MRLENTYFTNRKTIFLRYLENMLLSQRILKLEDIKFFRKNFADELLVLLEAYETDLYFDNHEELTSMFSHWTYQ